MTDVLDPPIATEHDDHDYEEHHGPTGILKWMTTTDHKIIGMSYTVTAVIMMVIGGALAEVIRAQLTTPNPSPLARWPTSSCPSRSARRTWPFLA